METAILAMASSSDKEVLGDMDGSKVMQVLTKNELERLTEVFKMYETGVREAAIRPTVSCDLRRARTIKNVERVKRRRGGGSGIIAPGVGLDAQWSAKLLAGGTSSV